MRIWSRGQTAAGLASATVGPATLPELALALDPDVPHVMLSDHGPFSGTAWTEALVPLTDEQALRPMRLRVTHLRYDLLLDVHEFLRVVDQVGERGAVVRQFARLPRPDLDYDDSRPDVRAARYRAFGLHLAIYLPHPHEVANLVALSDAILDASLERVESR